MQRTGWFPDERAYAGEEHLDPAYVTTYDRKSAHDHSDDLAVLQSMGLNANSVVVDLGAGTGSFALAVAPLCRRVIAVDVSPAMLDYIRAGASRQGISNLEVVHAGFLSYEHQGDPADIVYSRNALHHLPDFWKAVALKRVVDILTPGGVLRLHDLVYHVEPEEITQTIEGWLAGAREQPEDGWTRAELETHVREEYSTFSWLHEPLLERAGFEIREATYRPSRTYAAYTCVKR
ncbi:MAG TPA: class I SAM-dependent methyltransferase [Thermomicrobiales bacterium]|nr:class I SAM-dependent methyltransferase [Thermomicrobiales bacterium]